MENKINELIPIGSGLFTVKSSPEEPVFLIGMKCSSCGEIVFPKRHRCPRCTKGDVEEIRLSRIGELYSFTEIKIKLPNCNVAPPFLVGIIELPEGERIRSLLTGCSFSSLKIGQKMELVIEPVFKDESGNNVLGWKFKPSWENT